MQRKQTTKPVKNYQYMMCKLKQHFIYLCAACTEREGLKPKLGRGVAFLLWPMEGNRCV